MVTQQKAQEDGKGTSLEEKIRHALTEARVVLPGAQALLGFQLIVMLAPGFENLPQLSKVVHLGSLSLVALSTIFLMAPAAFHRIVEGGEATERMHRFTSCMLIAAMAALAPGMAGDLYVVTQVVTQSAILGTAAAIAAVALCYGLWFGYCLFLRAASAPTGRKEPATA